ncbi:MAG: hypothetical protein ACLQO7_12685 [Candidatus Bathyarchaeia archaeon]
MKPLNQKTKDQLVVIGLLALESGFVYNVVINFYNYAVKGRWYFLVLGILATIGTIILIVYLLVILFTFLDKRKVLKEFQTT